MNAVEIEQAVTDLAERPFDAAEFPFAFLQAFGNKETTLKRLRKGESNRSDLGGVLQTSNIHIAVAPAGEVTSTLAALKASPATAWAKAKFVLATDGDTFEAEDLASGEARPSRAADSVGPRSRSRRKSVTTPVPSVSVCDTEDGTTIIRLRARNGSVWLTQADMAELFQTSVSLINESIKGIAADGEQPEATIEDHSIVRTEGERSAERRVVTSDAANKPARKTQA